MCSIFKLSAISLLFALRFIAAKLGRSARCPILTSPIFRGHYRSADEKHACLEWWANLHGLIWVCVHSIGTIGSSCSDTCPVLVLALVRVEASEILIGWGDIWTFIEFFFFQNPPTMLVTTCVCPHTQLRVTQHPCFFLSILIPPSPFPSLPSIHAFSLSSPSPSPSPQCVPWNSGHSLSGTNNVKVQKTEEAMRLVSWVTNLPPFPYTWRFSCVWVLKTAVFGKRVTIFDWGWDILV